MNRRHGTDPTPQGRKAARRQSHETPPTEPVSQRYENSAPGPDVRKDGVYFFGYKRDLTGGESE